MKRVPGIWLGYDISEVFILEVRGERFEGDHFDPEDQKYDKMAKFVNRSTYPAC
jgi:hypothetical protein